MPAVIAMIMMAATWGIDNADRASNHWTKPVTQKEWIAQATRTVEYKYAYND